MSEEEGDAEPPIEAEALVAVAVAVVVPDEPGDEVVVEEAALGVPDSEGVADPDVVDIPEPVCDAVPESDDPKEGVWDSDGFCDPVTDSVGAWEREGVPDPLGVVRCEGDKVTG